MLLTSRLYRDEHDLREMRALLIAARPDADDWRYGHVGAGLVWMFFMLSARVDPCDHIRLWHDDTGELVGTAWFGDDVSIDWQIMQEYEWQGIEADALQWAQTRLAELRQREPEKWQGALNSVALEGDTRRRAFLKEHGFTQSEGISVHFQRNLSEPIPVPELPDRYVVRAMSGEVEITNRAGAHREAFHPSRVTDEQYARFMRLPGYDRDLDLVSVAPDGVFAAYAMCWLDPVHRIGEFEPVGARPAFRMRGLTRAVLLEGLRRMQTRGMRLARVSTGLTNTSAVRLYESVGFKLVNKHLEYVMPQGQP